MLTYFISSVGVFALMLIASACLRLARVFENTENCMCLEKEDNDIV